MTAVDNLLSIKTQLKEWETQFKNGNNGKKPDKHDILSAAADVQSLYKKYALLKRDSLKPTTLSVTSSETQDALSSWGGKPAIPLSDTGKNLANTLSETSSNKSWDSMAVKLMSTANFEALARKSLTPNRSALKKLPKSPLKNDCDRIAKCDNLSDDISVTEDINDFFNSQSMNIVEKSINSSLSSKKSLCNFSKDNLRFENDNLVRISKEKLQEPKNFFKDETPAPHPLIEVENDIKDGQISKKSEASLEKDKTMKKTSVLTFEDEWKLGSVSESGQKSDQKSGNLEKDGDKLTRRAKRKIFVRAGLRADRSSKSYQPRRRKFSQILLKNRPAI